MEEMDDIKDKRSGKSEKIKKLRNIIMDEQEKYVNTGDTKFEDDVFDSIVKYHNSINEENEIKLIGAPVRNDKVKISLAYPMPSLDKITYQDNDIKQLTKFMNENPEPYIISSKVDGTSIQLIYQNGNLTISTGGDGIEGFDVSYIKEYISFPQIQEDIVIRGELTISNEDFEEIAPKLRERGLKGKNSRNLVNGLVNRVETDVETLGKCFFVAFGILSSHEKLWRQFKKLKKYGFKIPSPVSISDVESAENFLQILLEEHTERKNSEYRTDGIVIVSDENFQKIEDNSNPSFAFAFKKNTIKATEILDVEWNVSRHGYLKPKALIEPVEIAGTTFSKISVYNAREVLNKGIGPGAIVTVTLSGDSIPKIVEIIEEAEPSFPNVEFHWNSSEVDIILDEENSGSEIRQLDHFLGTIGVKNCGIKTLEKIYDAGFDSVSKLIRVKVKDLVEIEGLGQKSATKLVNAIDESLKRITWAKIMAGCGIFPESIGISRCELFVQTFPNFMFEEITAEEIKSINGFGEILASRMADNLPKFKRWISKNKKCMPIKVEDRNVEKDLSGEVIVFTGVTASDVLREELTSRGATVKDNFVKAATLIVKKNEAFTSDKTKKAAEKGIKMITLKQFLAAIS